AALNQEQFGPGDRLAVVGHEVVAGAQPQLVGEAVLQDLPDHHPDGHRFVVGVEVGDVGEFAGLVVGLHLSGVAVVVVHHSSGRVLAHLFGDPSLAVVAVGVGETAQPEGRALDGAAAVVVQDGVDVDAARVEVMDGPRVAVRAGGPPAGVAVIVHLQKVVPVVVAGHLAGVTVGAGRPDAGRPVVTLVDAVVARVVKGRHAGVTGVAAHQGAVRPVVGTLQHVAAAVVADEHAGV